ncbi:MAG: glycosyl hydrolase 115 family protein [Sedimentisphaerales bacterium]|nr:glycosyl hydrolase 115 family protein [Sedimentisphaerales bacterium]
MMKSIPKILVTICIVLVCSGVVLAVSQTRYVTFRSTQGGFCLAQRDRLATLYVDSQDHAGVLRAVGDLQADIKRVTDRSPTVTNEQTGLGTNVVFVGTIGKSPVIDGLIRNRKIDATQITGKWESFLIEVVPEPLPGVDSGLVIAGSDKRGTIYGIYDLSGQIGVSPWYWWADVPVKHNSSLFVGAGRYIEGPPAVKYRGIFLNDEEPALGRWAVENYGGFTHEFYEKVFELILRMKGNYLWPAMWWASFNSDDPLNPKQADEYGIVMGTTHHEPMMRAHAEWKKIKGGAWNYETNAGKLRQFWTEGIRRMGSRESIVTLAMRGDGDLAMSESTNIALLEKIVADQRKILADVTNRDVTEIPQLWALYKEVQDYYDKGMRVPEDVTLLLCDDNWGNLRRLPKPDDPPRTGGYGIYYHFDFVGGPRNYKWLNTSPIARVWEQMHLAYRHGVDRIWLVNVGDLKPMEFPIEFFLDYAWSPDRWPAERLSEYTRLWAQKQFGPEHASAVAEVLSAYTRYNSRRKPEMLSHDTYSLVDYREAETIVSDYNELAEEAQRINKAMLSECGDAYYQLVLHPVTACANLNELHVTVGKNHLYAKQGRVATNDLADRVKYLFDKDAKISHYYNKILAGGKWNHMMDQTHISYTNWQQPQKDVLPKVNEIELPDVADMGVAIEGSDKWWPLEKTEAVLPEFDSFNQQKYYIEIFNRGKTPFTYEIKPEKSWLTITPDRTKVDKQQRVWVSVDFRQAPKGTHRVPVTITGPERSSVIVYAVVKNPAKPEKVRGFVESNGYVSIEAEHCTKAVNKGPVKWLHIPNLGRTLSGITPVPVTAKSQEPVGNNPRLEYCLHLFSTGKVNVNVYLSPTQNFHDTQGLRYAVSFDDEKPRIINIHEKDTIPDWKYPPAWNKAVGENIKVMTSEHLLEKPGEHVLKFWMIDPGIVLQKIVVDTGGVKPGYLGPPESFFTGGSSVGPVDYGCDGIDGSGAFVTGNYRNLFTEAGHSQEEVTAKINKAYRQFFHGDPNTQALYYPAGFNANGPLAYMPDINHKDVRSEGMSYGMMIAVQLDKEAEFDALWNWSMTYMYHNNPEHPTYGFFSWQMDYDGNAMSELPAPDGEEYYAMALYFAAARWGNGTGIYNYKAQADKLLTHMVHRKQITGMVKGRFAGEQTLGREVDLDHAMILFSPDSMRNHMTDPSYHLPAFYELWARWGPKQDRAFWYRAALASRDFFQRTAHPETGLSPNYANFDGTPYKSPFGRTDAFRHDAWRTAGNWAVDWSWWAKDPRERNLSDRIQAFFESQGMNTYADQYELDGTPLGKKHSAGLVGTNAVASLAAGNDQRARKFVEAIWDTEIPSGQYRYYDGLLYFMSLLHCSGQFRIWTPQL